MENIDKRRASLILLALFAGGAVPIQLITLSFGYSQYFQKIAMGPKMIIGAHEFAKYYLPIVYIPALLILVGLIMYSRTNHPDLFRRIVIGMAAGMVATVALDFFRQMGVINGWLPGDTPVMFGKAATGSRAFEVYYTAGNFIHFMNGANFGLFFTFIWGRQNSYRHSVAWAVLWMLIVELGMMTGPPMAPIVGLFGTNFAWPQFFMLTLIAHVAFGIVLGLLVHLWLKEEDHGNILIFLKGGLTNRS